MIFYFDDLNKGTSNLEKLSKNGDVDFWLVAPGSPIKKTLIEMSIQYEHIDNIDSSGIYWIDVRGDSHWWSGVLTDIGAPTKHILEEVPNNILELVRQRKLRIVIAADREGSPMLTENWDCFSSTEKCIRKLGLPEKSVLILHGDYNVVFQHESWKKDNLMEFQYSNHFSRIFDDESLPDIPIIKKSIENQNSLAFNSLNRTHRPQRAMHLYWLAKNNYLVNGLVSCNELNFNDLFPQQFLECNDYTDVMKQNYPRHVDGDWEKINAANQYNSEIYANSLISFITETIFFGSSVFITEKIFKPLRIGHPMILLASKGTLSALRDIGFRTDWCGIDSSYNDIEDDKERFIATHNVLKKWIMTPIQEKVDLISASESTILHNQELLKKRDLYKEAITDAIHNTRKYFDGF